MLHFLVLLLSCFVVCWCHNLKITHRTPIKPLMKAVSISQRKIIMMIAGIDATPKLTIKVTRDQKGIFISVTTTRIPPLESAGDVLQCEADVDSDGCFCCVRGVGAGTMNSRWQVGHSMDGPTASDATLSDCLHRGHSKIISFIWFPYLQNSVIEPTSRRRADPI